MDSQRLYGLWNEKVGSYSRRPLSQLLGNTVLAGFLVFLPALAGAFRPDILRASINGYIAYLALTAAVLISFKALHRSRQNAKTRPSFVTLLHVIHEGGTMAILVVAFWAVGINMLKLLGASGRLVLGLHLGLGAGGFVMLALGPRIIRARISRRLPRKRDYPRWLSAIVASASGIGVLAYTALTVARQAHAIHVMISALGIACAFALLPFVILRFEEVLLLGLRPWPEVTMRGSAFEMSLPHGGQDVVPREPR